MENKESTDGVLRLDAVETKQLCLVDDAGLTRLALSCRSSNEEHSGYAVVHLYDGKGRPRLSLQVDDTEGTSVSLFNQSNSPCISISVFNKRGNGITVCDAEGRPIVNVGMPMDIDDEPAS